MTSYERNTAMNPKPESSPLDQKQLLDADKQLNKLLSRRDELNTKYKSSVAERRGWLVLGLLFSALMPIYILGIMRAMGGGKFLFLRSILGEERTDFQLMLVLMALTAILVLTPALFHHFKARGIKRDLTDIETNIEETYLLSPSLRLKYFQKQFLRLSSRSVGISWIDNKRRKPSEELRLSIGNILSKLEEIQGRGRSGKVKLGVVIPELDDAQFLLAQWSELLQDEERELIGEKKWKIWLIVVVAFYLLLLILAIPVFSTGNDMFGIPFPIIVWSAVGSLAAILHRFYKSPRRINLEIEFRWLFARPIIGIIMGAVSYLALVSGALVFSATPSQDLSAELKVSAQQWQFWIVAFLGGFSDKFYEKIIEWLTSKFTASSENEPDNKISENGEEDDVVVTSNQGETEKQGEGAKG